MSFGRDVADWRSHRLGHSSFGSSSSQSQQRTSSPFRPSTSPRPSGSPLRSSVATWDGRPRSSSPLRSHSPVARTPSYGGWQDNTYGSSYNPYQSRDYPESPRRDVSPRSPRGNYSSSAWLNDRPTRGRDMDSPITQVPQNSSDEPLVSLPADFIPPEPDPGSFTPLLPPKDRAFANRHTLVLDLDETLVHSSFKPVPHTDILIDIKLDGAVHQVYVKKRPYVEEFLARMTELFEVVILTASLDVYADPVLDELDYDSYWIHHRLFRDSCANLNGSYIKDLSYLGRPLNSVIIVDNSPTSYLFQPRNAIPITSWFDDQSDRELRDMIPLLEQVAVAKDIFPLLQRYQQVVARGNRW